MNIGLIRNFSRDIQSIQNRKQYYKIFGILFLLFFFVMVGIFSYFGKVPVWDSDAISQHYPNLIYVREWFERILNESSQAGRFVIPQWDPSIGLGQDVFNVISLRPLTLLAGLFPQNGIILFIWISIALRLFFAGVSFSEYCFFFKKDKFYILIGALLYAYSSYAMVYSVKHYFFVDFLIFLPAFFLGIERILKGETPVFFAIICAFCGWCYFYIFYITTCFSIIYYIVRFICLKTQKSIRFFFYSFFKCLLGGIWGVGVASVSLLPNVLLSLESGRAGETAVKKYVSFFRYHKGYYARLIADLFTPDYMYLGLVLGLSGLAGYCVLLMIFKKKQYTEFKLFASIIAIFLSCRGISLVLNGFSGYTLRWSYCISFFACMAVVFALERLNQTTQKEMLRIGVIVLLYLVLLFFLSLSNINLNYGAFVSIFLATGFLFILYLNRSCIKTTKVKVVFLIFLIVEICLKMIMLYSPFGEGYLSEFHDSTQVSKEVDGLGASAITQRGYNKGLFRVDEIDKTFMDRVYNRNYGLRTGTNGLSTYYSYTNGLIKRYVADMGIAQQPSEHCILGLTHRTAIDFLNSVKYIVAQEESHIPYGYEKIDEWESDDGKNWKIYENAFYLPYIYIQDAYMSRDEFDKLSPLDKEYAMLYGCVLDTNIDYKRISFKNYEKAQKLYEKNEILSLMEELTFDNKQISVYEEGVLVKDDNVTLTIPLDREATNSEMYIMFNELEYIPAYAPAFPELSLGLNPSKYDIKKQQLEYFFVEPIATAKIMINDYETIYLRDEYDQYYNGTVNAVGNLGYYSITPESIKITFSKRGWYKFTDVGIYTRNMKQFSDVANKLKKNMNRDFEVEKKGNSVKTIVDLNTSKLICINIPWSNGWTAYINGEKVPIYKANDMYMAVKGEKGENELVLEYTTPGLRAGAGISISFLAFGIGLILLNKKRQMGGK